MIFGFSAHHGVGDDGAVGVIDYLLSPQPGRGGAARARPMRDPVPELLVGNPQVFATSVEALPWRNRYRSAVLSFAASDVDPGAFNAGAPEARAMVSGCLDLLQDTMFPGIPAQARPHLIIGIHTHVGRLEINVAVQQAVRRPDRQWRAWNPEPPGTQARDLWRAYQDMVNLRYGFADPSARARGTDARHDGDAGPHRYARPPHRGPGSGDLGAGTPLGHLAAADHLTRVVTTLTAAIAWLARHTSSLVALRHVDTLIPDTLVRSLSDLTRKMETCHAVLTSWRAGAATDRGTDLGPARSIAPIGAVDRTSDGIAVGRLGHDRRGGGAARATDSAAYGRVDGASSDRRGAERGDEPVGRDGADRRAAERDRVAADGAGREPARDVGGVAADRDLDAGGGLTPAPVGSRIGVLARVRAAVIAAHPGAKFVMRPIKSAQDNLQLAIEIEGVGAMVVSAPGVKPIRVQDPSRMRRLMRAIAEAIGFVAEAKDQRPATAPSRPTLRRERVLVLAETEAVARRAETIMAGAPRIEAIIRPAGTLTRGANIETIVEAVRSGQVTTCMLLSARPEEMRADVQTGWYALRSRLGASGRAEIRSIDKDGHLRRSDPSWASGALQIDEPVSEEHRSPQSHDPEDPTPGG